MADQAGSFRDAIDNVGDHFEDVSESLQDLNVVMQPTNNPSPELNVDAFQQHQQFDGQFVNPADAQTPPLPPQYIQPPAELDTCEYTNATRWFFLFLIKQRSNSDYTFIKQRSCRGQCLLNTFINYASVKGGRVPSSYAA